MNLKLKDGEMICNKCRGYGVIHGNNFDEISINCPKCQGGGVVDWVQNVIWKDPSIEIEVEPIDFDEIFVVDPEASADLYYAGNKIFETTKDGGIKIYA